MSGIFDQIINYSPPLIVSGTVNYKGTWNASTNNPTLNSSPAASTKGDYYVVSTAGTQFGITFAIGDWIISNGTAWEKVDLTDAVSSVFGRTGAVVGVSTDYSAVGLTNTAIGASSPSTGVFTDAFADTLSAGFTSVAAAGTVTTLVAASVRDWTVTGSGGQTYQLPDATTLRNGAMFQFNNNQSSGTVVVRNNSATTVATLQSGSYVEVVLLSNATAAGSWDVHNQAPSNVSWSTNTFDYPGSFTGGTWNGNVVQPNRGGTGVNNSTNTLTLAGNLTHAGAFTQSFTATANTALTLPTTGTLSTLAGSEALSNKTITASAFNGTVGATTASTGVFSTVGVGATPTSATLHVTSSGGALGDYQLALTRTSVGTATLRVGGSNELTVAIAGTDRASFTTTGLAVTGALSSTGQITAIGLGNTGTAAFRSSFVGSSSAGIDLSDSTDSSGASFVRFEKASGAVIGSITRVTTTDAVVYNTTSDGRLKENLRDFTDSGRLIDSLKPRVFDWKNSDENGKNVVGFIAQESNAADPIFAHIGAVSVGDADPENITKQWQRSDSALIPILVAELKALRQRVAALESN